RCRPPGLVALDLAAPVPAAEPGLVEPGLAEPALADWTDPVAAPDRSGLAEPPPPRSQNSICCPAGMKPTKKPRASLGLRRAERQIAAAALRRCLTAIPKIDASSGSIVSVQVILPDETRDTAIVWCRFLEHCLRIVAGSPFREPEANDCSDHCNLRAQKWPGL